MEQIFRCVKLKRCRDGAKFNFTEYMALPLMMDRHEVLEFDMEQLDPDIDYDTDEHMIRRARNTLDTDLFNTVEFMVTENPLLLVKNLQKE